jgi:hypothetical protein
VLDAPLFSDAHQLILPEGTHVSGTVVVAKKAGWFHHAGRLRFAFDNVQLSPEALALTSAPAEVAVPATGGFQFRTQAILKSAESGGAPVKVDSEGGVQAADSKWRFAGTALSAAAAISSGSGDLKTNPNGSISQQRNTGGRILGGGSGFGLLGTIASQFSPNASMAFGYYGLARSVYFTVIARGPEAEFNRNAAIDIGFSVRKPIDKASEPSVSGSDQ